jgi:RecG-like helicase
VSLKDLRKRLSASVEELDESRLHDRFDAVDGTPIAEVEPRTHVVVAGEVKSVQVVPRAGSPWLEVTISDGTGKATAVFSGRRRIAGIDVGRGLVLEGVAGLRGSRVQLMNPVYTLLA